MDDSPYDEEWSDLSFEALKIYSTPETYSSALFSFSSCFTKYGKWNGPQITYSLSRREPLAPVQVNNSCMIMKMKNLPTFIRFTQNILGVGYFDQVN